MKIAVIGAGWLGLPLCQQLKKSGKTVFATKRTVEDAEKLTFQGIDAFPYQLGDECLPETIADCDIYIINIAGGRHRLDKDLFQTQMQKLMEQCINEETKKLLFVSTTSVYGERSREILENSEVEPLTDSACAHVFIENFLKEAYAKQCCILRLAGLIGEDRNPAYHFEGKKGVTAAHKMVNFVHQQDAITAILKIVDNNHWGRVFHLCATEHPSRLAYYTQAAVTLDLVPPEFLDESEQPVVGKKVDSTETLKILDMTLQYPSPMDMLVGDDE